MKISFTFFFISFFVKLSLSDNITEIKVIVTIRQGAQNGLLSSFDKKSVLILALLQ